ncbi:hypothetical protein SLA2020_036080 [Shorea laevis]
MDEKVVVMDFEQAKGRRGGGFGDHMWLMASRTGGWGRPGWQRICKGVTAEIFVKQLAGSFGLVFSWRGWCSSLSGYVEWEVKFVPSSIGLSW